MVPATEVDERPRFLQGPGVCGNDLETRAWAGTRVLALPDGTRLGIRATSAPVLDAVAEMYSDLVVGEDGPALYSLALGEPGRRRAAPMHYLHHGGQLVLGTRDLGRLLRALVLHAASLVEPAPTELAVLTTAVALPDARLLLAPGELLSMTAPVDRVLLGAGLAVADGCWAALRPHAVWLPRPAAGPNPDALDLDALRALGPSTAEPVVRTGEHTIAGWLLAVPPEQAGHLHGAPAVAAAARLLRRPYPGTVVDALGTVVDAVARLDVQGVFWRDPEDLVEQVRRAAGA